jgi:N-acetylglucosaminyldiphosphoundecaprenol N-acetyl-beta-D-mannosaminyltransferase
LTEAPASAGEHEVSILGVRIFNSSMCEAVDLIERQVRCGDRRMRPIYIVNTHTLNLAVADPEYRAILNEGFRVFADGTGARWAARLRGVRFRDNLVGTDLVPALFKETSGRGYRYFLLGGEPALIESAAGTCGRLFPGWGLAGFHHGFVDSQSRMRLIDRINAARPDVLLVGMGNPIQERWIHRHRDLIEVPVAIGVGGLFHFWAGDLKRAPRWIRKGGVEWIQILIQQPHKWRRYLLGNPTFLVRMLRDLPRERR